MTATTKTRIEVIATVIAGDSTIEARITDTGIMLVSQGPRGGQGPSLSLNHEQWDTIVEVVSQSRSKAKALLPERATPPIPTPPPPGIR